MGGLRGRAVALRPELAADPNGSDASERADRVGKVLGGYRGARATTARRPEAGPSGACHRVRGGHTQAMRPEKERPSARAGPDSGAWVFGRLDHRRVKQRMRQPLCQPSLHPR